MRGGYAVSQRSGGHYVRGPAGYGYSLPPAIVALIGICGLRLVWIYTVFVNHRDYLTLIMAYPVSWLATTVVLAAVYYQCRKYILKSALAGK